MELLQVGWRDLKHLEWIEQQEKAGFGRSGLTLDALVPLAMNQKVFIGQVRQAFVGWALIMENSHKKNQVWLFSFGIAPECQSAGMGHSLFEALIQHLRLEGYQVLELSVEDSNDRALKIYTALLPVLRRVQVDDFYGRGHSRLQLSLALDQDSCNLSGVGS